jgi:hypothetical protein
VGPSIQVIGTIEALGVFLLAILPGFVFLRVYEWRRPPLQHRGALGELGMTVVASGAAWVALYLWRGQDLLPVVLGDPKRPTVERLDAFAELAGLSILLGFALGLACRGVWTITRRLLMQAEQSGEQQSAIVSALRRRTLPDAAWDQLLTRLSNRREPVICRVITRSGPVVLGVLAETGLADWEAEGRGLLLQPEVVRDDAGQLRPLPASQGVVIPGDEIAVLSVIGFSPDRSTLKRS